MFTHRTKRHILSDNTKKQATNNQPSTYGKDTGQDAIWLSKKAKPSMGRDDDNTMISNV